MSRLPPQFGPFEPLQRLGAGGMAETFVAVKRGPSGFEQRVCIKRILPAYEGDRDFVDAFLREARTSAQLRHANIVQVLDFGEADGSHYLALELVDGVDLRGLIRRRGGREARLPADVVTLIAGDLCMALSHAHGGGHGREPIVHRDISPSNVLASRAGEVKLTDFGIARAIGGTPLTATGIIKGKVPYLPPEYIERGIFDVRSDLFSLGVMLFELLAGVRPFDGESDLDTVRRIASGERKALRELAADVPEPLAVCIDQLLATAPEARPSDARAVLEALPTIHPHRARIQLGELVRAELGEIATGEAAKLAPRKDEIASAPTRTRPRALGRGPKLALSLASASALLLVAGVGHRALNAPEPPAAQTATEVRTPQARTPVAAAPSGPTPVAPQTTAPSAPAPAPQTGSARDGELRLVVVPFGDVWVDGKLLGHAPVTVRLAPGNHEFGWGDGRTEQRRTIRVAPGAHDNLVFRRDVAD